ncbi:homoserine kinase [Murinocardiopsis flavida]|uniref:Homoserine kinase n=1 Tax=Murinocardiopsis flavida TaxID=645275 RepID=A0A2P8CYB0_9ACTN|nr:homoserine kinase [Murinocardiopsis flavida]PSK89971.1 homoserine kinase [Murinocardiopsis flavida]
MGHAGISVRTPATSANLGPGFDALGLALGLYDDIEVRTRSDGRTVVTVEGEGAGVVPLDGSHLVVRAMRAAFDAAGVPMPGIDLHCTNRIPHARGLGSSSSAIVAGVGAALGLLSGDGEAVDRDRVYRLAADIEGHPDNVAPCVYGGFTVAWAAAGGEWRALSMDPSPRLRPVVCVPDAELSTELARGLLPKSVAHSDAAFTAGRAALLAAAVSGHPELLLDATEDRLHEAYRAPAMPGSAALIKELRVESRLPAVVSGAGPTVLVLACAPGEDPGGPASIPGQAEGSAEIDGTAADSIARRAGSGWHIRPLRIDLAGVYISSPRS